MAVPISDAVLDATLAIQVFVAWAGEGRCEPARLGWWDTDLVDPAGGGDLLARLLPRTHRWGALEAVREAARRTDAKARGRMATPDRMRTIFFLGFEVDEQLGDRLASLKRSGQAPEDVLRLPAALGAEFSKDAFLSYVRDESVKFGVVPGGRQVQGPRPDAVDAMVRKLAAGLVPLSDQYPMPFYLLEA